MKRKCSKIVLRYLFLLLIAIIVGVNFQAIAAARLTGNQVPMFFGTGMSVVMSGSMEPNLKVGDLILVRQYQEDQKPEVDDIIVYQTESMAIVHRVIAVNQDTITTMGDANSTADEPFDVSAVKGKVVMSLPLLGYVVLFLKTPWGIILTLGLAFLLMEYSFRKEKKGKDEDIEAMKAEIRQLLEEQKQE